MSNEVLDTNKPHPHRLHFYDTGNILLEVENVLFRIHQEVLCRHSEVFKDMFSLDLAGDMDGLGDQCNDRKVTLHENPEDFATFLDIIYEVPGIDLTYVRQCVRLSLLAHKYEVPHILERCRSNLIASLPIGATERDFWIAEEAYEDASIIPSLLRAARLIDMPNVIPWAVYELSVQFESKPRWVTKNKAILEPLSEHVRATHTLKRHIISRWGKFVTRFMKEDCDAEWWVEEDDCWRRTTLEDLENSGFMVEKDTLDPLRDMHAAMEFCWCGYVIRHKEGYPRGDLDQTNVNLRTTSAPVLLPATTFRLFTLQDEIHPALSAQLARIAIGATPETIDGPEMRSPPPQPQLVLAPARHTTVVTTTTTTTTTYQPISLPALPPAPVSPKDPKLYPLLHAPVPSHLSQFPLTFPNGARAIFKDPSFEPDVEAKRSIRQGTYDEERVGGQGWEMLRPADRVPLAKGKGKAREDVIHLAEAVDRYQLGRQKRVYESDNDMEGIEMAHQTISQAPSMPDLSVMGLINSPPPRKKARASTIPIPPTTQSLVAPPSPLPSPSGSPSSTPIQLAPPTPPIQPDLALTTLLALPQLVSHFSALPPNLQSHVLLQLLRQSTLPVLRNVHSVLTPALARDFLTLLPPELTAQILSHLPPSALFAAARVSRAWRQLIDQDMTLWRALLRATRTWFGGASELAYMTRTLAIRERNPELFLGRPQPHPFKLLYRRREQTRRNWLYNQPRRLTFPAHGSSVVTCLLFSRNRIISASDDHQIHVYSPTSGELLLRLEGHEGGVWALAVSPNSPSAPHATDSLVSGSTDRTVRIWDLSTGKCTHVFGGHTSTVRCLAIVKPMWIDVNGRKEKWPKRTLIVTGSRDHTLRVWKLPRHGDPEYRCVGADGEDVDPAEASRFIDDANRNPYHVRLLSGHTHAVRALAAHGRTLISGSYDTTVRVWDIVTGECKWTLEGHSQKVYSVVLDPQRNQAMSGSMDGTVRIWSLATGQALHTLTGHSSLVGLLGLSPTHLVSAAADSTLRIWDPASGALQHTLSAHTGAITCFQHDEFKVLSGSDGTLKMWDVREGSVVRDLLTGITGVWQVVFEGRWCVAASNRQEQTYLDVWDFGGDDPDNELEAEEGDWMDASESESEPEDGDDDIDVVDEGGDLELGEEDEEEDMDEDADDAQDPTRYRQSGSSLQHRAPGYGSQRRFGTLGAGTLPTSSTTRNGIGLGMLGISMTGAGSSNAPPLPLLDQTPTRPRVNRGSRASGSVSSRPY